MKIMKSWLTMAAVVAMTASGASFAQSMTKEQGDAILRELREIKQLLARQQPAAPAVPARPENLTIKESAKYVLGKSDAPVTMIAFTDFECPFCAKFEATVFPEIKRKYIDTGMVRFVLHDFPLDTHSRALKAALSVRCAGDQGKYWEMKERVIQSQPKIDAEALTGYAGDLGLNAAAFRHCMSDDKHLAEINEERKSAQSAGITATPTFIVGKVDAGTVKGKVIVGAQAFARFDAAIKEAMDVR